jgi:DNA-binding CsgD family transcriptional regulator
VSAGTGAPASDWGCQSETGLASAFVGRSDALATLHAEWTAVVGGASRICWIVGESGMGKTALARQFTRGLDTRWVDADEAEQALHFGVAEQLLRAPVPPTATELDVGADLLLELGGHERPVAVVIDDLHWADPPSLAALRLALRRAEADGALVVLISRPHPWVALGEAWHRLLDDPGRVRRIQVAGLSTDEVAALAAACGAGGLDLRTAGRLREHTGGHPLHTGLLLQELGADRIATAVAGILPAPRSFAGLFLGQVASLAPDTRDLISAGAVLGATFPIGDAARLAGVADPTAALGEAMAAGILTRAGPGLAAFAHGLMRGATYNDLSPTDLRDLHRAAAGVTSGRAALLHRVEAADGADEALAADLDRTAEAERSTGNHSVSSDLLLAAARVSGEPRARDRRTIAAVETLLEAADQPRATGLRHLVEACPPTAHRELVLALLDARSGRFELALTRFEASIARPPAYFFDPEAPGDVRARTFAGLAFIRWAVGDAEGACVAAEEALRGDVGWGGALTCYARAMSLMQLGRFGELDGAQAPARMAEVDRLTLRGIVCFYADDLGAAMATLRDVVRRGRRGESAQLFLVALGTLAEAEFRLGLWDDASINAELAVSLATDLEAPMALVYAHSAAAEIQAARGRHVESQRHLDQARAWVRVMPASGTLIQIAMARAAVGIARADLGVLHTAVADLTAEPLRSQLATLPSWRCRALMAEALLAVGDLDGADTAIAELAGVAESRGYLSASADVARLRGQLAEARGELADALDHYACDVADARQSPLGVARLALARGLLLKRQGPVAATESAAWLRSARTGFAALGAVPFLERCDAALGRAAERPTTGLGLSPRQEAVALLVADGLTNKEIAAELYLSTKGVEYHLSQIYARTGLGSRRELARQIRGDGRYSR